METTETGWALVTGASGGIGAEFARLLSREGWPLVIAGRDEGKLEALKASLEGPRAAEAIVMRADLAVPGAAEKLAAACARRGATIELLVNNAGLGLCGPTADFPAERLEAMIAVNVSALTSLCALIGRQMRERGRGAILNVGSFAGNQATPYFAAYAATKSYVLSFSLALRAELAGAGVRVCCLLPGYVKTGFDASAGIESPAYRAFSESNGMSPAAVARAGLRGLERNRPWFIAGARNKVAGVFMGLLPRSLRPRLQKFFLDRLLAPKESA